MMYVSFARPSAAIFLDPLTVFVSPQGSSITQAPIKEHAQEFALHNPHRSKPFCLNQAYTRYFSSDAVQALHALVQKLSHLFQVVIVLTSGWGNSVSSTEELQELFSQCPFKANIIDAVQLAQDFSATQSKPVPEGQLIDYWLREKADAFQIHRLIIIGRFAEREEVRVRFNPYTVMTNDLRPLNEEDMQKAYLNIINQADFQIDTLISNQEIKRIISPREAASCALL